MLTCYLLSLIPIYLKFLNNKHAKRREELGKSAQIVDESMLRKDETETSKAVEVEGDAAGQQHRTIEEDNALRDMTDLKNEDFIYVY